IQRKLRDQLSLRLDISASAAFKEGRIKAVPDGTASLNISTNGAAGASATANLNVYHVEQLRDYMYSTLTIAPYDGDNYVCVANTKALRGIKRDPNWEKWKTYADAEAKFNSEVGKIESVRFVESNNNMALSAALGTNSVLGEAVFFG